MFNLSSACNADLGYFLNLSGNLNSAILNVQFKNYSNVMFLITLLVALHSLNNIIDI
jgi:hypothetical protein